MTTPQLLTQMTRAMRDKALLRGEAGAFSWKEKPRARACSSGEEAVDDLCRTLARTDFTDVASQLGSPHHSVTSCNANTQTELVTCNCNFKEHDEASLLPHHYVELTEDEFPDPAEVDGRYEAAVNRVSAEVASQHCETARVATEEAARAAAAMLQQVTNSQPAAASDGIPQHESSQNSTSFNDMRCRDGFEAWPAPKPSDFATRAAAQGLILAWCEVKIVGFRTYCIMQISEFIDIDANLDCVGISRLVPLTVTIPFIPDLRVRAFQLSTCELQPEGVLSASGSQYVDNTLGLKFLVPHVVSSYLKSITSGQLHGIGDSNVSMQKLAWYLNNLNLICCICQQKCFLPAHGAQVCHRNLCRATYDLWCHVQSSF